MEMIRQVVLATCCWVIACGAVQAAAPSADQALALSPIQEGVDYSKPTPAEVAKCTINVKKFGTQSGWIVEDPNGITLRRFVDTNGDNVVDQWSYYKDGVEVYRDIDSDHNGKADQYRWFNTAGTRWGLDKNEDRKIDTWKVISPEEVTAEVVAALAERNTDRFAAVALTADEAGSLGLGKEKAEKLAEKIATLVKDFKGLALRQNVVARDTRWTHFSGGRPGVVPAGTEGSTKDVRAYENVLAIFENGGKSGQLPVGTLVQVGDGWRAIDLPQIGENQAETAGFFFTAPMAERPEAVAGGRTDENQKLIDELQKIDEGLNRAVTPQQRAQFVTKRAEALTKLAEQTKAGPERGMWYRQLADMLSGEVQNGVYPDGAKQLGELFDKLKKGDADKDLVAHIRICQLTADYGIALQAPKPDFLKVQTEWLKNLEQFVGEYPKSPDAAEAMLQLGMSQEFSGQEDQAAKWYGRIIKEFPQSPAAQKATGAQVRLESVGKPLPLSGKSPAGGTVDVAKFRGKPVLIHYWATWSEPAKRDIATIKELARKHGANLAVVGVNLDLNVKDMNAYVTEAKVTWPQIWEEGSLDSRPANQLGILTVPTTILLDAQGKVVNRAVASNELESEVGKVVK